MKVKGFLENSRSGIDKIVGWEGTSYLVIMLILFFLLSPFYWILVTSFKSMAEVFRWPPTLFPEDFTLSAYRFSLITAPVPTFVANSVIYSLSVAAFIVIIGSITTYGLVMYPYRGSDKVFLAFFATRILPPQCLWLPLLIFFARIGLIDTRPSVIIFDIILVYPLCIWMLKGLFDDFPRELIDSASIDGCGKLGTLFRIVMPVMAPGIAAVAIIAFLWTWNDFMFPFLVLNSRSLQPITVGVYYFVGDKGVMWNALCATGVIALTPGIVFFIIAQKHIVRGLSSGAIK